jgi:hypothetical protein
MQSPSDSRQRVQKRKEIDDDALVAASHIWRSTIVSVVFEGHELAEGLHGSCQSRPCGDSAKEDEVSDPTQSPASKAPNATGAANAVKALAAAFLGICAGPLHLSHAVAMAVRELSERIPIQLRRPTARRTNGFDRNRGLRPQGNRFRLTALPGGSGFRGSLD